MEEQELIEGYQEVISSYQAEVNKEERKLYLSDLFLFNQEVMGWPPLAIPLHKDLCEFIQSDGRIKLVLLARGHLKSSLVTCGYSLQRIAKNPNVRILIANATYDMAVNFLGQIKAMITRNKKFIDLFGDMGKDADRWRENQIKVIAEESVREYETREATVTAMGIDGNLVSTHYDLIIMDDVVSRQNTNTTEQINKTIQFYRDALDLLEPDGELIVVGTRWNDADLYGWMTNPENPSSTQVKTMVRGAIENPRVWFNGQKHILEGGNTLFPAKFTHAYLQGLLDSKGPNEFSAQYLNELIVDSTAKFRREYMHRYNPEDMRERMMNRYIMIDPAISEKTGADYTAMVVVGMDEFSKVYVLEIVHEQLTPIQIIDRLYLLDDKWKPKSIGIEVVAYQKALQYFIAEEGRKRNSLLPIVALDTDPGIRKEKRIEGLQPYYARGDIYHPTYGNHINILETQLLRFPHGGHDDIIDALAYFPQLAFPPRVKNEREDQHRKYLY